MKLDLHWSLGKLCAIFYAVLHLLHERWGAMVRLDMRWFSPQHCPAWAQALRNKNSPHPNCIGFIDGVTYAVCRPQVNQRCMYSGHKKEHCYREQAVVLANGLIVSMMGPYKGASNDQELLNRSGLLDALDQNMPPNYHLYGDKAYTAHARLASPYRHGAVPVAHEVAVNAAMSKLRIAVEW